MDEEYDIEGQDSTQDKRREAGKQGGEETKQRKGDVFYSEVRQKGVEKKQGGGSQGNQGGQQGQQKKEQNQSSSDDFDLGEEE